KFIDTRNDEAYKSRLAIYQAGVAKEREFALGAPEREASLAKAERERADAERLAAQGGIPDEKYIARIEESNKNVANLPESATQIRNAKAVLPQMFTGKTSDVERNLKSLFASLTGVPPDPRISATEQYKSYITGVLGTLRPQVVGTGSQSNTELNILREAAADPQLQPDAIEKMLSSIARLTVIAAANHNKLLPTSAAS